MGCDSDELAVLCSEKGLLLAPGRLFSPHGTPSEWLRVNVATDPELMALCIRTAQSLSTRRRAQN
jgi:DNA-binding transcriptional MocR family regulator